MIKKLPFALICSCLFSLGAKAQQFNTTAIQQLWRLIDQLKQDKPLTDSLWNAYYNLPGNKNYIEANRDLKQALAHRHDLELVFRPSMQDSLPALRKRAGSDPDDILRNVLYIHDHEAELRNYTGVITSAGYLPKCIALAKRFLPAGKYNEIPKELTIYISAMTFDAAVQSPAMYFGLSIIYEFDRYQQGTIAAHELHHQLRVNRYIEKPVSSADSASYYIVYQVNNEATADLVDKTVAVAHAATLYDAKGLLSWLFDDAPKVIRRLDSALQVNATNAKGALRFRDFRKLTNYSSGHVPGFYMTTVIVRNGGEKSLIAQSDNVFQIFYLYNKLAKNDKEHPPLYSEATISYLKRLEKAVYRPMGK